MFMKLLTTTTKPSIVEVPPMRFLAVEGTGDPNEVDSAKMRAVVRHSMRTT